MRLNFKNYSQTRSRHLIMGSSRATRGNNYDDVAEHQSLARRKMLLDVVSKKSLFEIIWYIVFFLAGIACLIFVKPFTFELAFAVMSLFFYMVSENLNAKGNRWGFVVSLTSSVLYVIDCLIFKVYGEVAINLLVYMPIAVISFFNFKRAEKSDGQTKFLEVRKLKPLIIVLLILGVGILGFLMSLVLNLVGAEQSLLNSLSVVAFLVGMIINSLRFIDTWLFDILGNVFTLLMWVFVSAINPSSFPFILSSLSALINDFYGIYYWKKLHKKSAPTSGVLLAKRDIKINHVIKLRRQFKHLRWSKDVDVDESH